MEQQELPFERSKLPGPWEVPPGHAFCGTPECEDLFEPKNKISLEGFYIPSKPLDQELARANAEEVIKFWNDVAHQPDAQPNAIAHKDSNQKEHFGNKKLQLNVVPNTLVVYASLALLEGALKYGRFNWRAKGVRVSTYLDALKRHIAKYEEGEWADQATNVPHLSNALACLTILLDAGLMGKLTDDRPPSIPNFSAWVDGQSGVIEHLKEMFAKEHPKQYTIADSQTVALNSEETCPHQ